MALSGYIPPCPTALSPAKTVQRDGRLHRQTSTKNIHPAFTNRLSPSFIRLASRKKNPIASTVIGRAIKNHKGIWRTLDSADNNRQKYNKLSKKEYFLRYLITKKTDSAANIQSERSMVNKAGN